MILYSDEARCQWKMQMQASCLSTSTFACRYRSSHHHFVDFWPSSTNQSTGRSGTLLDPGTWNLPRFLVHCSDFRYSTTDYLMHKRLERRCNCNNSAANEVTNILPLNKCDVIHLWLLKRSCCIEFTIFVQRSRVFPSKFTLTLDNQGNWLVQHKWE